MKIYGHGKVGRNVTVSHCHGQRINTAHSPDGQWDDFSFDVYGVYTVERATRFARRITGDRTIVINNVEHETHYYAMELDRFVKTAERIENGN